MMKFKLLAVLASIACLNTMNKAGAQAAKNSFDRQAHRGGRGLMPENTIRSEEHAIDYDCTLEMDLQMSRDKQIVVSHDAYFNSAFCLTPQGDTMTRKDGLGRLIYQMDYDSVRQYETGLKPYPEFPRQQKVHAYKPLLGELVDSVEAYARQRHHVNHYNIEIKSNPKADGKYYSSLDEFTRLAMDIIVSKGIADRTMIQSFDVRALQLVRRLYPRVKLSLLVDAKNKQDATGYIRQLGFKPDIFSPEYSLTTPALVDAFHEQHVLVIPWTPDTQEQIQDLVDMGVDGVITDYPDLFAKIKFR